MSDVLQEFVGHLRRAAMPEPFVAVYESVGRQFLKGSGHLPPHSLGEREVAAFCEQAERQGATEQQLRNVRRTAEALVWFLQNRARPSLAPPPETKTGDARAGARVPFLREVAAPGLGPCRSSDLGPGGMFLETMAAVVVGNVLELCFLIEPDDLAPVTLQARVVYTSPAGIGLAFRVVPSEVRRRIDRFLAAHAPR